MAEKRIPQKITKVVQNYIQRLSREEKLPIKKVIIFGSHAKGKRHKWSDIDVCILSPRFQDSLKAIEFLLIKRERGEVIAGLEPVGFTEEDFKTSSSLIEEIKRTGVVLQS